MIASILGKMILYYGEDVRRINHALKVYGFARCIARQEKLSEKEILIVEIASVLHDIGIKEAERKYNSSSGKYQEVEGPPVARELLDGMNIEPQMLERVCYLIGNHHSYQKIDGLDFQILVEADFLVNVFENEMPAHSIEAVKKRYFKTETGGKFLENMYLRK
ncbi:MAG: HD domain-containing protein [Prolixibacteraceae bacterium]|nr:HD domain-containing protein [Prolixibacteraceae bacterium]